jgi:hypothetical protein
MGIDTGALQSIAGSFHSNGHCILIQIGNRLFKDSQSLRDALVVAPNPRYLVHPYPESRDVNTVADNT